MTVNNKYYFFSCGLIDKQNKKVILSYVFFVLSYA